MRAGFAFFYNLASYFFLGFLRYGDPMIETVSSVARAS